MTSVAIFVYKFVFLFAVILYEKEYFVYQKLLLHIFAEDGRTIIISHQQF